MEQANGNAATPEPCRATLRPPTSVAELLLAWVATAHSLDPSERALLLAKEAQALRDGQRLGITVSERDAALEEELTAKRREYQVVAEIGHDPQRFVNDALASTSCLPECLSPAVVLTLEVRGHRNTYSGSPRVVKQLTRMARVFRPDDAAVMHTWTSSSSAFDVVCRREFCLGDDDAACVLIDTLSLDPVTMLVDRWRRLLLPSGAVIPKGAFGSLCVYVLRVVESAVKRDVRCVAVMAFPKKEIVTVAVTGAAGQIGYALCPLIARGLMLGAEQKVELRLLDLPQAQQVMDGVAMELQDCNFATLAGCVATSDPVVAFTGCDVAVMCGAFPRKQGMDRKDLLKINADIFTKHGETLKAVGAPHCRVLVVGNPANTNALLLATASSGVLDPRNVTALTRLDHNRATAMAALKAGGPVRNVVIWGNHSGTQVPDVDHATCAAGTVRAAAKADEYFDGAFIPAVQQRGAEVIKMRGLSSAASAASAIVDHVRDWICGTAEGEYVSMAVTSNGNPYGIPEGLVFSFPVTCKGGEWTIVGGLDHTDKVKEMLRETVAELQTERTHALGE